MPITHLEFNKKPHFLKVEVGFFSDQKVYRLKIFLANFIVSELIMSEVSNDLRNIFFSFIIIHHHSFIHHPINVARVQVSLPRRLGREENWVHTKVGVTPF